MSENERSEDSYAGIARGNGTGLWEGLDYETPMELVAVFNTVMPNGQPCNYALPIRSLCKKIENAIIGSDEKLSLTEAFRAAQAIKQAGKDIKEGKISFNNLPSWHTAGAAEHLYQPNISAFGPK